MGLIAEKIAPLATSSTDWKIIQKIDLRKYFRAGTDLTSQCAIVTSICHSICDAKALKKEVDDAVRQSERVLNLLMVHEANEEPRRVRRSLLPFIGTIHKFLFGTLNEADEAAIQKAIRTIASDTRETAALLANQTEIVEHSLSNLDQKMATLEATTARLANKTVAITSEVMVRQIAQDLENSVTQFKLDTEVLTDAILFAAKGMIHPRIVPPGTIARAAKTVKSAVTNAEFPLPGGQFAAIPVMKISRVSILFSEGYLIYHIAIPLLDIQRFNLFRASPLPTVQKVLNTSRTAVYVWPEHHYFAISEPNRTYMPIPQERVVKLRKLNKLLIAVNPEPIREIKANAACEIKIASGHAIENPENCDIRIKCLSDTFWLRLHEANTWVFSATEAENIFIQCQHAEQLSTEIKGAGLLRLRPGCTAHTASARLTASREIEAHLKGSTFETLQINIAEIIQETNRSRDMNSEMRAALNAEGLEHLESLHGASLEALGTGSQLREVTKRAREVAEKKKSAFEIKNLDSTTSVIGYSTGSSILLLALIVAAIGWILRRRTSQPIRELAKQQERMLELDMARQWRRAVTSSPQHDLSEQK